MLNAGMVKQKYNKCRDGEANIKGMEGW